MAQEVTIKVTAEDLASGKLSEIAGDLDNVGDSVKRQGKESERAGKKSGFLSGKLGDLEVSSIAAGAGITQLAGFLAQGVDEMLRMEQATTRFTFAMRNAGATSGDINRAQVQMKRNFRETAFSIVEQEQAMERLARKTGDADIASENLRLAMDLAAATGEDLSDVSKDLAEALTGDIGALEQLGVLTEESADRLRGMDDSASRAAGALDILRQKVSGASEEIDPQVKSVKQMRSGWRELNGELSSFAMIAAETTLKMVTLNKVTSKNATATQKMATAVGKANQGLGALPQILGEMELIDKDYKNQTDAVLKFQAGIFQMVGAEEAATEVTRIRLGITEEATSAQGKLSAAIKKYGRDSKEAENAARAYNDTLRETNNLSRDQMRINRGFAGLDFPEMPDPDPKPDPDPDPKPEYASKEEIERRKADIAFEAQKNYEKKRRRLEQKRREQELENEEDMREEQLARDLSAIDKRLQADLDAIQKKRDAMNEMASYQDVGRAISQGLSGVGQGASGVSRLLEQATRATQVSMDASEAEKQKAERIRVANERLARQLRLYGQLSGQVGGLSKGVAELASVQWDFSKAGDASLSAVGALSGAGEATAGILGKNTKQQAGIQAAFEAAAAVAAGAMALTNPAMAPQFGAAAAQHAVAAGMYAAVAGGAGEGTSASTAASVSTGASGGGGGGGAPAMEGAGRIEALTEAERMEGQSMTIINDFSGATLLESQPATQNRINDAVERGRQRMVNAGGRG